MIKIYCLMCTEELKELGGLLFSPPDSDTMGGIDTFGMCDKYHLCITCYETLKSFIKDKW